MYLLLPTLNWGFEVIVRHAVSTSTFLSLFCVFGKLDPRHITKGVLPSSPVVFFRKGANRVSQEPWSTFMSSEAAGDAAGGLCTKLDGPLSAMAFDNCSFVFGQSPVPCCTPGGLLPVVDGVAVVRAGEDDDDVNEGVRCETGDNELGGLARSAWKSTVLVVLGVTNVLLNNWSSASWFPPSGGVQCSPNSKEPGVNCC